MLDNENRFTASLWTQRMEIDSLLTETVPACARHLQIAVATGGQGVSLSCVLQGLDGLVLLLNSSILDCTVDQRHRIHHLLLQNLGAVTDDILHSLFDCSGGTQVGIHGNLLVVA